jgi:hypothetical protein
MSLYLYGICVHLCLSVVPAVRYRGVWALVSGETRGPLEGAARNEYPVISDQWSVFSGQREQQRRGLRREWQMTS